MCLELMFPFTAFFHMCNYTQIGLNLSSLYKAIFRVHVLVLNLVFFAQIEFSCFAFHISL